MNNYIGEIEINTCNICGADCFICARSHGAGNEPFMKPEVFSTLVSQLKDIKSDRYQTSGNGDCFLNPHYIEYLRILKREFPKVPRWCYTNFQTLDKGFADEIIAEQLGPRPVQSDYVDPYDPSRLAALQQLMGYLPQE